MRILAKIRLKINLEMSLVMRKPAFCICENKVADQLRSNCAADQRLCFRYTNSLQSLYFLNLKFQAFSHFLWLYSMVCVGPGRKPRRPVFSQRGSYHLLYCCKNRSLVYRLVYAMFDFPQNPESRENTSLTPWEGISTADFIYNIDGNVFVFFLPFV